MADRIAGMRSGILFGAMGLVGLVCGVAAAQSPADPMGEWVMRVGQRTMFVLSVEPAKQVGQACAGSLARPQHLQTGDGISFSHVEGPTEREPIVRCERKGEGLAITVENPKDAKDRDAYVLTLRDAAHAALQQMDGLPWPLVFERASGAVAVSTDWDPEKSYSAENDVPSNAEMKKIFDEDQRVRQPAAKIDWTVVGRTDA